MLVSLNSKLIPQAWAKQALFFCTIGLEGMSQSPGWLQVEFVLNR